MQEKSDFPHRLVYRTLYVETVARKWSVVVHEAAGQFAKVGSVLDHTFVLGLFARFVGLVVEDV